MVTVSWCSSNFGDFLAPLEHLLERLDQVHQRDDHLAFDRVAGVERAVRARPHVRLDLLLLVQQLRGVLEFLVFEQPVHQLVARILLLRARRADRPAAASSI